MVKGRGGYSYEDRLRILGVTNIETRFLIKVFKILIGFENLNQPGWILSCVWRWC